MALSCYFVRPWKEKKAELLLYCGIFPLPLVRPILHKFKTFVNCRLTTNERDEALRKEVFLEFAIFIA